MVIQVFIVVGIQGVYNSYVAACQGQTYCGQIIDNVNAKASIDYTLNTFVYLDGNLYCSRESGIEHENFTNCFQFRDSGAWWFKRDNILSLLNISE